MTTLSFSILKRRRKKSRDSGSCLSSSISQFSCFRLLKPIFFVLFITMMKKKNLSATKEIKWSGPYFVFEKKRNFWQLLTPCYVGELGVGEAGQEEKKSYTLFPVSREKRKKSRKKTNSYSYNTTITSITPSFSNGKFIFQSFSIFFLFFRKLNIFSTKKCHFFDVIFFESKTFSSRNDLPGVSLLLQLSFFFLLTFYHLVYFGPSSIKKLFFRRKPFPYYDGEGLTMHKDRSDRRFILIFGKV